MGPAWCPWRAMSAQSPSALWTPAASTDSLSTASWARGAMAPSPPRAPQVRAAPAGGVPGLEGPLGKVAVVTCGGCHHGCCLALVVCLESSPSPCTSPKTQSCRAQPQLSPIFRPLSPSLQGHPAFQKQPFPLCVSISETRRAVDEAGTKRPSKPRLGEELQVTGVTSDSVGLSWTVPEGHFDSFVIQYRDRDGQPQVVPVEGSHREVSVSGLDPARRYKLLLYGLSRDKRVGPISAIAVTGECSQGNLLSLLPTWLSWSDGVRISELPVPLLLGEEVSFI